MRDRIFGKMQALRAQTGPGAAVAAFPPSRGEHHYHPATDERPATYREEGQRSKALG